MTDRESKRSAWWLAAVACSAIMAGCGSSDDAEEPHASGDTPTQVTPSQRDEIDSALAQLASDLGLSDPPEVAIVRVVSQAEFPSVYADCMTSEGFPTKLLGSGQGTETDIPSGQEDAATLADYTCAARYPTDPTQDPSNLTDGQKKTVYAYLTDSLVDCLESHGFVVNGIPGQDAFLAGYDQSPPWNPYDDIYAGNISQSDAQQLESDCPPNTPPELIYGGGDEGN